ncbi:MAG: prephenate dehydratase [bacterium]|nr:prephenate dehydratase [bacterium]
MRERIDRIDDQILDLLNQRAGCNAEIGRLKAADDSTPFVPGRELDIFERLERQNPGPFPSDAIRNVFREIISASISLQRGVSVAYLGPPATYTHQAAIQQFGRMAELLPAATTAEIFEQVENDTAEFGVVPVENSNEGVVSHTLDLFVESPVTICAEIHVAIHHDLLSKSGDLHKIKTVRSHPQGLAQCRGWLALNMPNATQESSPSTAFAAEQAARDDTSAAIASSLAAGLYGLESVQSGIEDNPNNTTRFLVISKTPPKRSERDITSLLFSIKRDLSGALYKALEPFAEHDVNLTRIESRPTKARAWEYVFFCDFEGHVDDERVGAAIESLRPRCDFVKVLGSYPQAETLV